MGEQMKEKVEKSKFGFNPRISTWFHDSWWFPVIVVLMLTTSMHAASIASVLMAPPHEGFSRELEIAQIQDGEAKMNNHLVTAAHCEDAISIFSAEELSSRMFLMNDAGVHLKEYVLPIQMMTADRLSSYFSKPDELTVLYLDESLHRIRININTGQFVQELISESVEDYRNIRETVVIKRLDGLYGINLNKEIQELFLSEGSYKSFGIGVFDEKLYVAGTKEAKDYRFDGHYLTFDRDFKRMDGTILYQASFDKHLIHIEDVKVSDDLLTIIYNYPDRKASTNHLSVYQVRLTDGLVLDRYVNDFAIYTGDIKIVQVQGDQVTLMMQQDVINGVNIVLNTLSGEGIVSTIPLTKTRGISYALAYFNINGNDMLMFYDVKDSMKILQYASSDPELVKESTDLGSISIWQAISSSLVIFFVALFASLPMAVITAPVTAVSIFILNKALLQSHKRYHILLGAAILIHTAVKITALASGLMSKAHYFGVRPSIFGFEPGVYLMLIISSTLSFLCLKRFNKDQFHKNIISSYAFFGILDMVLFASTTVSYGYTMLLLYKI